MTPAAHHGSVGDPARPAGRPGAGDAARADRGARAGPGRGAGAGDGGRRELQRRLGRGRPARLDLPLHGLRLPHRRLGRVRDRRQGRAGRDPVEAGRRGRHPLQPELRRVRRVQRPRPDGLLAPAHLGVRVELGQLRRALPGAGPAAPAQAAAADLGGGGLLRAHLLHRLPDAGRPRPHQAGRQRAGVGRRRRPGDVRGAALQAARGQRDRRRLVGRQGRARARAGRGRRARPARVRAGRPRHRRAQSWTRSSASAARSAS